MAVITCNILYNKHSCSCEIKREEIQKQRMIHLKSDLLGLNRQEDLGNSVLVELINVQSETIPRQVLTALSLPL